MAAAAGQRVVVEEALAVERQAAQGIVVQRLLQDVAVAPVALEQRHAVRPEHQPDRGAGLGVGRLVGQVIVGREAFVVLRGAEPAGDIEPLAVEVAPQTATGLEQGGVLLLGREVGHGAVEVHGAHGVTDDAVLLAHRHVALVVVVGRVPVVGRIGAARPRLDVEVMRRAAALVDEVAGEIEVAPLAGQPVEPDQRQLDLLVAAIAALLALVRPEQFRHQVDLAAHDVEQVRLAGRLVVRDGGLDHVADAVELVPVAQVAPLLRRLAALEEAVEIAVRLLRLGDARHHVVDQRVELGIGMGGERIARRLDPLGDVGIPVHHRGRGVVLAVGEGERARRLGDVERLDGADLHHLAVEERHGALAHRALARRPQPVLQFDLGEGNGKMAVLTLHGPLPPSFHRRRCRRRTTGGPPGCRAGARRRSAAGRPSCRAGATPPAGPARAGSCRSW